MDVSIIIVNYNTRELIRNCLNSVLEQTKGVDYEIIVSDNGSKDGSLEMIKEEFPFIILIENNANLGFGMANNKGAEIARGKYLFFLNSDTILLNNAVKLFFDYMETQSEQEACCGCILQNNEGKEIHSYGNFHTLYNCLEEWVWRGIKHKIFGDNRIKKYDNPKYQSGISFRVQFVTGADLFVRNSVAKKYGLFDKDFFMYSEEMDLQQRYFKNGYYSSIITTPKIVHLEGGSNVRKPLSKKEIQLRSVFTYQKKHLSKIKYYVFLFVFKTFYCPAILFSGDSLSEKIRHIRNILFD